MGTTKLNHYRAQEALLAWKQSDARSSLAAAAVLARL